MSASDKFGQTLAEPPLSGIPLMTREAFAQAIGLPLNVLASQADKGYWPQIKVGRRVFINVEAVRIRAAEHAEHYVLGA